MLNFCFSAVYSEHPVFYHFTIFHSKLFTLPLTSLYQKNGRTLSGKLRRSKISHHFLSNKFVVLSLHTPFSFFLSSLFLFLVLSLLKFQGVLWTYYSSTLKFPITVFFQDVSHFLACSLRNIFIHICSYLFNISPEFAFRVTAFEIPSFGTRFMEILVSQGIRAVCARHMAILA